MARGSADSDERDDEDRPLPVPAEEGSRALVPSDPYRRYVAEAKRFPPLTREEEQELARRYRETGDRDALFRLITANLMMVVHVASTFRRTARNLLDAYLGWRRSLLRMQRLTFYDFERDVPVLERYGVRLSTED